MHYYTQNSDNSCISESVQDLISANRWFLNEIGVVGKKSSIKIERGNALHIYISMYLYKFISTYSQMFLCSGASKEMLELQNICDQFIMKIEMQRRLVKSLKMKVILYTCIYIYNIIVM